MNDRQRFALSTPFAFANGDISRHVFDEGRWRSIVTVNK